MGESHGNAAELPDGYPERKYDKTADNRGGTGADKRISKAEFIDRDAKPHHDQPCNKGKHAESTQQNRHTFSTLS